MSVTFTPKAGAVVRFSYYRADPNDTGDIVNGVIRFTNDFPDVNMANANAAHFLRLLQIGEDEPNGDRRLYGEIAAEAIDAVLNEMRAKRANNAFLDDYFSVWEQLLLHCAYHNCGITYG